MAVLTVGSGSGFDFNNLSAAVAASQNGDVIEVQAGTYTNDFSTITIDITIEGVGGLVHLVATEPPPNLKGILTIDGNVTLDNLELSGAAISSGDGGNGAGIRFETGSLVLNNCYVHDNQDGLLADTDLSATITINNSEFADNGNASPPSTGIEHNIYVGQIQQLTINSSYIHGAIVGHEIKSRALNTTIQNSRIANGPAGDGSYAIDLPNGGNAVIENNVIEKGPSAGNPVFISFGEEGNLNPGGALLVAGNTVLNDYGPAAVFVENDTSVPASITGNTLYGLTSGEITNGPVGSPENNTLLPQASEPTLDTSAPYLPVLPFSFSCFVAGTRILTSDGEVPVESLRVGQHVVVRSDIIMSCEAPVRLRPVRWIGHRHIDLARHRDPRRAQPIRIRANAFADDLPRQDLLLSPEHAILVNGLLIPAGLLQNGASIAREARLDVIRYFHVELDEHDVLFAEGLPAESFLDTGNRGVFENAGTPLVLHPDFTPKAAQAHRADLSCAPFADDPARVEPVWRRLAERAECLGFVLPAPTTSSDPQLHLLIDGHAHWPVAITGRCHVFALPSQVASVRLVSRADTPCDVMPWRGDDRRLGVAVRRIVATSAGGPELVSVDNPALNEGWWEVERDGGALWRWTNGNASLPLPADAALLGIEIMGDLLYRTETQVDRPAARKHAAAA